MKKKTFSLVELLITIAIIAILAALLMPALRKAKDKAMDLFCISNLKQFGVAFAVYRGDADDTMPLWASDLYPTYISSAKAYHCPLDQNPPEATGDQWKLNVTGTGPRPFSEAYDFPATGPTGIFARNIPASDPRKKLKISYFYEFAFVPCSWSVDGISPSATWWDIKYFQMRTMAPCDMTGTGYDEEFQKNKTPFAKRLSTFPVLRCFWHMKALNPSSENYPVFNLSYNGNIFYSGPQPWEVSAW